MCKAAGRLQDFLTRLFNLGLATSVRQCQYCWLRGLRVQVGRKTQLVFETFSPVVDARCEYREQREVTESN